MRKNWISCIVATGFTVMYKGELKMENSKVRKMTKRYMNYCAKCGNLSFQSERCEECGSTQLEETPRRYGLTNLACISMSVMDFEAMKKDFLSEQHKEMATQVV